MAASAPDLVLHTQSNVRSILSGVETLAAFDRLPCPVCQALDGLSIRSDRSPGELVIGDPTHRGGGLAMCQTCQAIVPWGVITS
jgi:hypothetical protein